MGQWTRFSCDSRRVKEQMFVYPLGEGERFEYFSPGFSDKPKGVEFLGVYDPEPDKKPESNSCHYDFIMGSGEGSGAFTFPNPRAISPYRSVDETECMREAVEKASMFPKFLKAMRDGVVDAMDLPEWYKGCATGIEDEEGWFELGRVFRPYEGFFRGGTDPEKQYRGAVYRDVRELRLLMERFSRILLGEELPEAFRDGVITLLGTDPRDLCERFGIPLFFVVPDGGWGRTVYRLPGKP